MIADPQAKRRKRLLINPRFQTICAVYATVTTLLMVPIFMLANYYFFNMFALKAHNMGLPEDHELLQFVSRQQALMVVVFIGATVLAILINVIASYIFSNRIAGSMYRLQTELNQAPNIESAQPINYRKEDFFSEVFEAYNLLLQRRKS